MMTKSKTILFAPIVDNISETLRSICIAEELKKMGNHPIIGGSGKYEYLIHDSQLDHYHLDEVPLSRITYLENDKGSMSFYSLDECRKYVSQRVECVHKLKPDMIVLGGLSFLTKMASRITGVPSCSVVSSSIYDFYFEHKLAPYSDQLRFPGSGLIPEKWLRAFANWYFPRSKMFLRTYNKVLKEYDAPLFKRFIDMFHGDLKLASDVKEIIPVPPEQLPDDVKFVGPILPYLSSEVSREIPEEIEKILQDKPMVYFSIGSTGSKDVYKIAVKAFKDKPYSIILTTLGQISKEELGDIPANVSVFDILHPEKVNAINATADVVVCHGGQGTLYTALASGTPIVGIPQQYEQECNVDLIVRKKLGVKLSYRNLRAKDIIRGIERILSDPEYSKNAREMQGIIRKYNGAKSSAMEIASFLENERNAMAYNSG
jgi:MGT family glycosyltransferase